jgi:hypothetical protein
MENVRVKELKDFSNDFLRRLGEDEEEKIIPEKRLKTEGNIDNDDENNNISKRRILNLPDFSLTKLYKAQTTKKKHLVIKYIIL